MRSPALAVDLERLVSGWHDSLGLCGIAECELLPLNLNSVGFRMAWQADC